MSRSVVIAVDGTAASGKGTLAKKLAGHFGFAHLDSGSLYRLTALSVLDAGRDPANAQDAERGARAIDLSKANDPKIRTAEMGQAASQVAAVPAVRAALLDFQLAFLAKPPDGRRGAVMDGRDIGTVICPTATAKLFIDARPEVRAHRRWLELERLDLAADEGQILAELKARDLADSTRAISPLKPAADACLLDTSDLDIDAAFAAALDLVKAKVEASLKAQPQG